MIFQRGSVYQIIEADAKQDPLMFRLSQVKTGVPLKGLYYKENLKPLPKIDPKLEKILDQRTKDNVKQIKVQTQANPNGEWQNIEDFFFQ